MRDYSRYKQIASTANLTAYSIESDLDILIGVPFEGTKDNALDARENVAMFYQYARSLGKPIGSVIILTNMLAQEPEARRAYSEMDPTLFFAAGLVVENPLSRALGSFFIGLSRPKVPTKLFDSVETAIEWLKSMRPG